MMETLIIRLKKLTRMMLVILLILTPTFFQKVLTTHSSEEISESEDVDKDRPRYDELNEIPRNCRRRKVNKKEWKRSIVKELRLSGKKYIKRSGTEVSEKRHLKVDCLKCRFKCQEHFSENQREQLCAHYYSIKQAAS